jgi:response regulator RpfG family c-di-GMP phosphodiesterase
MANKKEDKQKFSLDELLRNYRSADQADIDDKQRLLRSKIDPDLSAFVMQHYDRVLILERNQTVGEAACQLLRAEGYNVEWEKDRQSALEVLKAEDFSAVLVTEGYGADALFIRDQIKKLAIPVNVRTLKDFGNVVMGHEEADTVKKLQRSFHHLMSFTMRFLEAFHPPMIGHASEVARIAREVAIRMEQMPDITDGITVAAYIHELPELQERYKPFWKKTQDIFEDFDLDLPEWNTNDFTQAMQYPFPIEETLKHMQERYDGKGYPDGLNGESIPIGCRIIAPIDIFLTMISSSAGGPNMSRGEALDQLIMDSGSAFDPTVVEILVGILKKELSEGESTEYRETLLMVDDLGDDDLQKIQLREEGYVVLSASGLSEGIEKLTTENPFMIVSDIDLSEGDGFQLLDYVRKKSNRPEMPFLFMSARNDPNFIARAFRAGTDDYLPRPCAKDMLLARLARNIARTKGQRTTLTVRRGVTGNLKDMGLMEIIQILSAGMKSAMITITHGNVEGRIALSQGNIVYSILETIEGEEAFFALLNIDDAEFGIHTNVEPPKENITMKNDMLLLEGFRRKDEKGRPADE